MPVTVKLSDELVKDAETHAAAEHRSVSKQIEYWGGFGKSRTATSIHSRHDAFA